MQNKQYLSAVKTLYLIIIWVILNAGLTAESWDQACLAPSSEVHGGNLQEYHFWKNEIESFSENERQIFEEALTITGLNIGFDFDGTIIALYPDIALTGDLAEKEHFETFLLRPGMRPLLIGLLFNNSLSVVTAANSIWIESLLERHAFLKKLFEYTKVTVTGKNLIIRKNQKNLKIKKDRSGQIRIQGISLTAGEDQSLEVSRYLKRGRKSPKVKIPDQFGLDILFDDNPALHDFIEKGRKMKKWKGRAVWMEPYMSNETGSRYFLEGGIGGLHEYDQKTVLVRSLLGELKRTREDKASDQGGHQAGWLARWFFPRFGRSS